MLRWLSSMDPTCSVCWWFALPPKTSSLTIQPVPELLDCCGWRGCFSNSLRQNLNQRQDMEVERNNCESVTGVAEKCCNVFRRRTMYFQLNFRFEPYIQKQLGSPFTKNASDPQPETNENMEPCNWRFLHVKSSTIGWRIQPNGYWWTKSNKK